MVTDALLRFRGSLSRSWPGRRHGFTLIEVAVAAALIGIGVVGAAAALTLASTLLARAELEERAAILAATLLDSIAQAPAPPEPGQTAVDGLRATWSILDVPLGTAVELVVEPALEPRAGWRFATIHTEPLPHWPMGERDP